MQQQQAGTEFDAIVVGSGTCGATIARELSAQGKRVLVLERGGHAPLRESFVGIASIAEEVKLGDGSLSTVRALTAGGSTSLYFGVANYPPLDAFRAVGVDLAEDLDAVRAQLPLAPLPDALLTPQSQRLRDGAVALGHAWDKFDMLVDPSKCAGGYAYEAKWKARDFLTDAVARGATLVTRATVDKVLVDQGRAIGVEYRCRSGVFGRGRRQAFAARVVLAAGELATPKLLRDSGVREVGDRGFYCNPGYAIYGLVRGLRGTSGFVGCMGATLDDGIELGDANLPKALHTPMMLGGMKLKHLFAFGDTIGIGVKVKDAATGELTPDGRFRKTFGNEDLAKLDRGKREAVRILERAGANEIVDFGLTAAGRVGGLVRIGEHVDANFETRINRLHVCDGSVIPDEMRGTPTVTLVAMARYLSRRLLAAQ